MIMISIPMLRGIAICEMVLTLLLGTKVVSRVLARVFLIRGLVWVGCDVWILWLCSCGLLWRSRRGILCLNDYVLDTMISCVS